MLTSQVLSMRSSRVLVSRTTWSSCLLAEDVVSAG
jgi:hypothetical protein